LKKEQNLIVKKPEGNRKKYVERKRRVIEDVELVGSLAREQIQLLHYGTLTDKCQRQLFAWSQPKIGLLQRGRCDVTDQYVYWIGKKPYRIDHNILLNWIYVAAKGQGIEVKSWIAPYITDSVEPDIFSIFCYEGKFRPLYFEFQRAGNNSPFDKPKKYIDYFLSMEWLKKEWAKNLGGTITFPSIITVTDGKKDHIQSIIERDNKFEYEGKEAKLDFRVATLEEIRQDIRKVIE
jgi:hypothetical protein